MAAKTDGVLRLWRVTFARRHEGKWRAFAQVNVAARSIRHAMRLGVRKLQLGAQPGVGADVEPLVRITSSKQVCQKKARLVRRRPRLLPARAA